MEGAVAVHYFCLFDGPMEDPDACTYVYYSRGAEPNHEEWSLWCRKHGIDADDIPIPGWIRRDKRNYRVEYLSYVRDENGNPRKDPETGGPMQEERFVQLEGRPLPFPESARFGVAWMEPAPPSGSRYRLAADSPL
jgi:hypothetical protein